ncbi:hypothetical protein Nepgr_025807 [Nepenthes gracilis]|uniref:Glycosyltransferase n=1 Tax=Nepenthes gracilis TaxID=150966 RepID=A0AAD3T776_NEPGR|nr:hypothetical protein Nepgr_025807 [Nepenthes gracilis]
MKATELLFIPMPLMGHFVPAVELARRIARRDERISITILVMKFQSDETAAYVRSLKTAAHTDKGIEFVLLPELENPIDMSSNAYIDRFIEAYKPIVKQTVQELLVTRRGSGSQLVRGIVSDMIIMGMLDVAKELDLPRYVFSTYSLGLLCLMLHFQSLRDDHRVDFTEFKDPDTEFDVPGFRNRVPSKVLPPMTRGNDFAFTFLLNQARRCRDVNGILVNSFTELESDAHQAISMADNTPPVYPVGPIINHNPQNARGVDASHGGGDSIMRWLDHQPPLSVVFLCFGSMGCFGVEQVKEVADGLEQSGHRFLWSLRRPAADGEKLRTHDYDNFDGLLPDGFLDRTASIGRVIGWAPQAAILNHPSTGAFVSHCGWNSTLESLWFGAPIAAWPMFADQHVNAFRLVKESGLAVEIRLDYVWDRFSQSANFLVKADELERGIRKVMDTDSEVRKKMKEMKEETRRAIAEGGSSYTWLGHFIEDATK